jgi:plasmid stability protein
LDADVLARPVTRTLLLLSGPPSGFAPAWSATVEEEADRHRRSQQKPVAALRPGWSMALTPTGANAAIFGRTSPKDRQVLADAAAAAAFFLITGNVSDFAAGRFRPNDLWPAYREARPGFAGRCFHSALMIASLAIGGVDMSTITVRNLPAETHRALRLMAARHQRSTEAEVRAILEEAARPDGRLKLGSALAAVGRELRLTEEEFATMEGARDRALAEPLDLA